MKKELPANSNTKNKACRSGNREGRPGRNTEILAEHAEMQLGK